MSSVYHRLKHKFMHSLAFFSALVHYNYAYYGIISSFSIMFLCTIYSMIYASRPVSRYNYVTNTLWTVLNFKILKE